MESLNDQLKKYSLKEPKENITYTTVLHQQMNKLKISFYEYCICDFVFKLGGASTSRDMGGWVYASKQKIADSICITRRGVHKAIDNLISRGLLEKHPKTRHLRTTDKWYYEVVTYKEKLKH